ncbi:MAG: TlpA family protein disulfide reductase [Sandaracinaceae bacterium]|nr:TlpA family protein disulfide reductase [Sandaracinaceae bacterium]
MPALALSVLCACGAPASEGESSETTGITGGERPVQPAVEGSVELTLRYADGTFLEVGDLRGRIVVLYVLTTYDGASQMGLRPLRELVETSPEVEIVAIAAQQGARLLVDAYEHALSLPFRVAYDPVDSITGGTSALGELEAVPTLVVLDARGLEVARYVGYCDTSCVSGLLARAR